MINTPLWHVSLKVESLNVETDQRAVILRKLEPDYYIGIYSNHDMIAITAKVEAADGASAIGAVGDRVCEALRLSSANIYQCTARRL